MTLLRRISVLVPQQIDTEFAPRLATGVDVPPTPEPPRPATRDDGDGCGPLSTPAASRDLPSVPPAQLPGICYHHGHIEHDGERLGVLVLDDRDASLLRCRHVNRDGR